MPYNKNIPYNDLPYIPPVDINLESTNILKKAISANNALAELRGWTFTQSNPLLLLQSISMQEAKASSEIENVVTTNDELYQAFSNPTANYITPSAKEVMHYKEALWHGYQKLKDGMPLTINTFIDLFRIIKNRDDGIRRLPRTVLKNAFNEVVYTPPDNETDILRLLSNLERYINDNQDDVNPLIKLAIMHYQFECIHPFPDGNGRVGRILNVLYLVKEKLLPYPILYLSRYIIDNKDNYYRTLKDVTENNNWEPWILYMLSAIEDTANKTLQTIIAIYKAKEETKRFVRNNFKTVYSLELIELLFEQPYCKIEFLVERGIAKNQTASKYLKSLYEAGVLDLIVVGKEKYYINKALWKILTKQ